MSSITDVAPVPATRTDEGEERAPRKPRWMSLFSRPDLRLMSWPRPECSAPKVLNEARRATWRAMCLICSR